MAVITVTADNFEREVISSEVPVLLDFWAEWCGPCRMFSPTVEQFADENPGAVKVGKVNVDEESELAARFGVMSIPTSVFIKNGKEEKRLVGLQTKDKLEALL